MSKRRFKRYNKQDNELTPLRFAIRCLLFTGIFFALYLLASLVACAFLYTSHNPTQGISIFALVCGGFSSLVVGFILSKINGEKWLFSGIVLGILITAILFLISLIVQNETKSFIQYLIVPVFCIFGAFLGKKRIKANSRKRHR